MANLLGKLGLGMTAFAVIGACVQYPILIVFVVLIIALLAWLNPRV